MERLQNAISIAKIITKEFFTEVVAQFSSKASTVQPEEKGMSIKDLKEKLSKDAANLNVGEAVGCGIHHQFEFAQLGKMIKIGDCDVYLRLYKNKVGRVMKKPNPGYDWGSQSGESFERLVLSDYTPDIAKKENMVFSIAAAIEFTKREFGINRKLSAKVDTDAAQTEDVALKAVFSEKVMSPQWNSHQQNQHKNDDSGMVKISKGTVIFADKAIIRPQGRGAYTTFTVVLKAVDGSDIQYSGVELEKLFMAGEFSVGDNVILKKRVETFSKELGGTEKTGVRNSYEVEIIQN